MPNDHLPLAETSVGGNRAAALGVIRDAFDASRLTQARHRRGLSKKDLATLVGVTAPAITQYELGTTRPRVDVLPRLARELNVPAAFFMTGRAMARADATTAHFRSLRKTRAYQRSKALAYVEQAWEVVHALEKRVQLPAVDLPGFAYGEADPPKTFTAEPVAAANRLRKLWNLGMGPVTHLIRRIEAHGIVVLTPPKDADLVTVDAYSVATMPRPMIVITSNRYDDVFRHRFSAAHELGHLVMHSECATGDVQQEREADTFAAEFLTPRASILPDLPARTDFVLLAKLRTKWGVSVDSLVYRCRELGLLSDSSASRAYQRLHKLRDKPGFELEPTSSYPGEHPSLLREAFMLASQHGFEEQKLADELAWNLAALREFVDFNDTRPKLRLV